MRDGTRTRTRGRWIVVAPLLAVLIAGCGKEYVHFRPASTPEAASAGWVEGGEFRLPPGIGRVRLSLAAEGVIERKKHGPPEESLHVRFSADNRGQETFVLHPAEARLIDDEGRTVVGAAARIGKDPVTTIDVPAGGHVGAVLVFPLAPGARFDTVGSLRLAWPYRYGDKSYEAAAKFIKVEEIYYYYYGPYYPPYYAPYCGPYPYRPYDYYYRPYYYPYYYCPPYHDPWFAYPGYPHAYGGLGLRGPLHRPPR